MKTAIEKVGKLAAKTKRATERNMVGPMPVPLEVLEAVLELAAGAGAIVERFESLGKATIDSATKVAGEPIVAVLDRSVLELRRRIDALEKEPHLPEAGLRLATRVQAIEEWLANEERRKGEAERNRDTIDEDPGDEDTDGGLALGGLVALDLRVALLEGAIDARPPGFKRELLDSLDERLKLLESIARSAQERERNRDAVDEDPGEAPASLGSVVGVSGRLVLVEDRQRALEDRWALEKAKRQALASGLETLPVLCRDVIELKEKTAMIVVRVGDRLDRRFSAEASRIIKLEVAIAAPEDADVTGTIGERVTDLVQAVGYVPIREPGDGSCPKEATVDSRLNALERISKALAEAGPVRDEVDVTMEILQRLDKLEAGGPS